MPNVTVNDATSTLPQVSVVIPSYNQARYLGVAIESVWRQTFRDFEIIVVDDDSTDDTVAVAWRYRRIVRYVWQENQGLAGARNTGIREARGRLVALLDSDDAWLPTYLERMLALAAERPQATVYYCGVKYVDADGRALPQAPQTRSVPTNEMYEALLRANFLVPSTILMRRRPIVAAGAFDPAFRRLQDWELWLRLLAQNHQFAGLPEALVHYRLHGRSLSTDPGGGQQAALALAQKHFGSDDGRWAAWPAHKRRMYGGVYRYHALTSILSGTGDWESCAAHLRRALQADPTLALDLDLFYELALGEQALGRRGILDQFDFNHSAARLRGLLEQVFAEPLAGALAGCHRPAQGTTAYALGLVAYNAGQPAAGRRCLWQALGKRRDLWLDRRLWTTLAKSFIGRSLRRKLRRKLHRLRPVTG